MAIFNSYVSLPEGIQKTDFKSSWNLYFVVLDWTKEN